ncbi:MAG TPA: isochorismatase family protein [Duganella sp.]|nr:isochorismatase family protein [Duganella sp.]
MQVRNAALVIIDMQKGMADPAAGTRNNPDAEQNIAALLQAWRTAGSTVVHVRHISRTVGSPFWPGQPGAEFQELFAPVPHACVMEKNVPACFAFAKADYAGTPRSAEDVHAMALSNLDGEYAAIVRTGDVLDAFAGVA